VSKKLTRWQAFVQSLNTVNLSLLASLGFLCLFLVPVTPTTTPVVLVLLCIGFGAFIGAFLGALISLGFIEKNLVRRKEVRRFMVYLVLAALFVWGWYTLYGYYPGDEKIPH